MVHACEAVNRSLLTVCNKSCANTFKQCMYIKPLRFDQQGVFYCLNIDYEGVLGGIRTHD
jgi:hypothetical protein